MEPYTPTCTIFAIPSLFALGPYCGELEGITFIAQSGMKIERWFVINCGQFESAFGGLLTSHVADQVMSTLRRGASISLPGQYPLGRFASGFHQPRRARSEAGFLGAPRANESATDNSFA